MFLKRKVRYERMRGKSPVEAPTGKFNRMSNEDFFTKHKIPYRRL